MEHTQLNSQGRYIGRSRTMMPHMHNEDQFVFERQQVHEYEIAQRQQLAALRQLRPSFMHSLLGSLGAFFVRLGTRIQQYNQHTERAM